MTDRRASRIVLVTVTALFMGACAASADDSGGPSGLEASASVTPSASPASSANASPLASLDMPSLAPAPADPTPTTRPTTKAEPTAKAKAPAFDEGLQLVTVVDHVRLRSRPSTGEESIKFEPVLPLDTELHTLEGPVAGSGYWWYRVKLSQPAQHLFDGTREGWVAVQDHDGTPWVDVLRDVDPGPPAPATITGWPAVRRDSVVLRGGATGETPPGVRLPVEVRGLLPGTEVSLVARGAYKVKWMCGGGPPGEAGAGITDAGTTRGRDSARVRFLVGDDGIGRAALKLVADPPADACPPDYPGPMFTWERHWSDLRVQGPNVLMLTPPPFDSADTV
jgi:hypothetical protein